MPHRDLVKPVLGAATQHAGSVEREGRFPYEAVGSLRSTGLLGLTLPVSVGGLGGSPAEFLDVTRAIASRCASTAMVYLMHVCAAQVTFAGTAPDRARWLHALICVARPNRSPLPLSR